MTPLAADSVPPILFTVRSDPAALKLRLPALDMVPALVMLFAVKDRFRLLTAFATWNGPVVGNTVVIRAPVRLVIVGAEIAAVSDPESVERA